MSQGFGFLQTRRGGWLAGIDPRLKLAWLVTVSLLSVLIDSTLALTVLFGLCLLVTTGLRLSLRGWAALVGLLLFVAWGTVFSQALFYDRVPRTVVFTLIPAGDWSGREFSGLHVYREGAAHGLTQSLRALSVIVTGLGVCLTTSPERLLAALARLGVPVAVGFTATAALRFLPTVLGEFFSVRRARRLRGYRPRWFPPGRLVATLRGEASVLMPVLAASLRRAGTLATSVTSRGFDATGRRTYYPPLRFRPAERLTLAVLIALLAAVVTAKLLFWMYLGEIYSHSQLRGVYDFVRVWL